MDWKQWFKEFGREPVFTKQSYMTNGKVTQLVGVESVQIEEVYLAFKARFIEEMEQEEIQRYKNANSEYVRSCFERLNNVTK